MEKTSHPMEDESKICARLKILLEAHAEWLLVFQTGKSFALKSNEIEIECARRKILCGFLHEKGFESWRVKRAEISGEKISLDLTRNFAKENSFVELIPREKAEILSAAVELARIERAERLARLLASENTGANLKRVTLERENGRCAEILFEKTKTGGEALVLADVSDSLTAEFLLSTALLRSENLQRRKKNRIDEIWIAAEKKIAENLQILCACLKSTWKTRIKIKQIARLSAAPAARKTKNVPAKTENPPNSFVSDLSVPALADLWRGKSSRAAPAKILPPSDFSKEIERLAPGEIDRVFTANGETLRYRGLPFLRVRKIFGEEKAWFGIGGEKRILDENSFEDFYDFFRNLERYRRFDSPNRQHLFYGAAPEAWLESILRKNIALLDANLFLSPIYNQFRASRDKIDLLALRRDGRLVIIELKTSPDREMIFQAIDYWRKIELLRRRGILRKAKIFGEKTIAEKPSVIYLAAPTLSFHRTFDFLAKTVSEEIEIFRFDLTENWRENLKVLGRKGGGSGKW